MPVYVRWLKYITYVWYAGGALLYNEFLAHTDEPAGQLYACPEPAGYANDSCKPYTGAYIVDSLGFPFKSISVPICALIVFIVGFFFGSAALLGLHVPKRKIASISLNQEEQVAKVVPDISRPTAIMRALDVTLSNYELQIQKHRLRQGRKEENTILRPVNITFEAAALNVILGPSGSGKTSLLNMMSGRLRGSLKTRYETKGDMRLGGSKANKSVIRSVVSYVEQGDDHLIPTLTVRETLHYAAGLRLPSWMSANQKIQSAESVMTQLNLRDCAKTMIGGPSISGVSRGEKRRVSIGMQLLTDPHVLLLDEPTSGLDAFTAKSIVDVLRGLAAHGKTIIFSIHQPRSDLFQHFGSVLILARGGHPMYAGKAQSMLSHFAKFGHDCPKMMNPSDFVLDLVTVDLQHESVEAESGQRVHTLAVHWASRVDHDVRGEAPKFVGTPAELGSLRRGPIALRIAFLLLLRRSGLSFWRKPGVIYARIVQVFGFAVLSTLFWAPLKSDYVDIQSRVGFIQNQMGLYFVGVLQNLALYPAERDLFYSEHDDCAYSVEAFILQYTVLEIPFEIISSLLFAVLVTFAVGLPRTASIFFIEAFNCFCLVHCGESLSIMFNTFSDHAGFTLSLTTVVLAVALLMAGVFSVHPPAFLQAWNHLSPAKWALGILVPYTLRDQTFTCGASQRLANGTCPISTGQQVLELYNLDTRPEMYLMALGICVVAYRTVAYLLLKLKRSSWSWRLGSGQKFEPGYG